MIFVNEVWFNVGGILLVLGSTFSAHPNYIVATTQSPQNKKSLHSQVLPEKPQLCRHPPAGRRSRWRRWSSGRSWRCRCTSWTRPPSQREASGGESWPWATEGRALVFLVVLLVSKHPKSPLYLHYLCVQSHKWLQSTISHLPPLDLRFRGLTGTAGAAGLLLQHLNICLLAGWSKREWDSSDAWWKRAQRRRSIKRSGNRALQS